MMIKDASGLSISVDVWILDAEELKNEVHLRKKNREKKANEQQLRLPCQQPNTMRTHQPASSRLNHLQGISLLPCLCWFGNRLTFFFPPSLVDIVILIQIEIHLYPSSSIFIPILRPSSTFNQSTSPYISIPYHTIPYHTTP